MLEDGLHLFQLQGRGDAKHALVAVETAVCHEDVGVRIESQEIAEGLHSDDGAGDGILFVSDPLRRLYEISQTGAWTQAHSQSHTGMINSSLKRRRMMVFLVMAI